MYSYNLSGYPPMSFYLNQTGRSIFLACEYPVYQLKVKQKVSSKTLISKVDSNVILLLQYLLRLFPSSLLLW